MGAIEVGYSAVRPVVELIAENGARIVRRLRIHDAAGTSAATCTGTVIYRLAKRIGDEKLQAVREPPGEAGLQRMICGLCSRLVLVEAGNIDTLERCAQRGILR